MVRRHDPYFTHEEGESQRASAGKGKPKSEPRSLTVEHTRSTEQGANVDLFNGWTEYIQRALFNFWHLKVVFLLTCICFEYFLKPTPHLPLSPPCKAKVCSVIRCGYCLVLDEHVCTSCISIKSQKIYPGNSGWVRGAQTLSYWLMPGTDGIPHSLPHLPAFKLRECAQCSFMQYLVIF